MRWPKSDIKEWLTERTTMKSEKSPRTLNRKSVQDKHQGHLSAEGRVRLVPLVDVRQNNGTRLARPSVRASQARFVPPFPLSVSPPAAAVLPANTAFSILRRWEVHPDFANQNAPGKTEWFRRGAVAPEFPLARRS